MDSEKQKPGGGSGGGAPVDHNDMRFVDGVFERVAPKIVLLTGPSNVSDKSFLTLIAAGETGFAKLQGSQTVIVRSGNIEDPTGHIPSEVGLAGVTLYAPDAAMIYIQRGNFGEADSQCIKLDSDGTIYVDAGVSGTINLSAGPDGTSYIQISPTGITIKGPLVQIN